jgi:radical SAM protein with 4Fe4S-binding SPASM domain
MPSPTLRLLFWELTARCNLRCRHCRAEAGESVAGELATEEILRVAEAIRAEADPIIILTGGEPLQRADFFAIAARCTQLFSRVALATNGTLVDDALAGEIARTGIQRVSVSFDGARAETHDRFRGVAGSFADARRGFAALRRAGLPVQANMTVTRQNRAEVDELLHLLLSWGAEAFHVFLLVPVGCGADIGEEQRVSAEESEALLRWLCEKSVELRGRLEIKPTCAPSYLRIMRETTRRMAAPPTTGGHGLHAITRGCLAGSGVCFISRIGDVQPCGYLPLAAGNVRETPLGAIWRESAIFAALRDPDRLSGKCGACGYRQSCQGCRARAYAATGDYLAAEPDCPYQPPQAEVAP